MTDPPGLEERIAAIEQRLFAIEQRLNGRSPAPARTAVEPAPDPRSDDTELVVDSNSVVATLGLVGRTLVVLGGAFLLRYLTEAQTLPQLAGTMAGIAYALLWVLLGERAARNGDFQSATFHGISAAIIGFPLLWETTLTFHYLTPPVSAAAVALFTAISLYVARQRGMHAFALVTGAPAAVLLMVMGFATESVPPFYAVLLLLGLATLLLAYERNWVVLAGIVALMVDVAVLESTLLRLMRPDGETVTGLGLPALALVQVGGLLVYLGGLSLFVFRHRREVATAELAQIVVALTLTCGGFAAIVNQEPAMGRPLGLLALLTSLACYLAAYGSLCREHGLTRTFTTYSTVAAVTALLGSHLCLAGTELASLLSLAAIVCFVLARRPGFVSLAVHAALYLLAAVLSAGVAWEAMRVLAGIAAPELGRDPSTWVLLAAAAVMLALSMNAVEEERAQRVIGHSVAAPMLVLFAVGAALTVALFSATQGAGEASAGAAIARGAVLSIAAVAIALLGRRPAFAPSRWLVAVFLLAGGARLLLQDLPNGRASVLFGGLAFYGAALILAPRLLKLTTAKTPEQRREELPLSS